MQCPDAQDRTVMAYLCSCYLVTPVIEQGKQNNYSFHREFISQFNKRCYYL